MKRSEPWFLLIAVLSLTLSACKVGGGSGGSGPPARYMSTYYRGERGMLYFVKPFEWNGDLGSTLSTDITFIHLEEGADTAARVNFSLFSDEPVKEITDLTFLADNSQGGGEVEKMYVEQKKKKYLSRYGFFMSEDEFFALIRTEEPLIRIEANGKEETFRPKGRWKKLRQYLDKYLVQAIELNQ